MLYISPSDKSEAGVPETGTGENWVRAAEMGSDRKEDLTPEARKQRASSLDRVKKLSRTQKIELVAFLGINNYYLDISKLCSNIPNKVLSVDCI